MLCCNGKLRLICHLEVMEVEVFVFLLALFFAIGICRTAPPVE